MLASILLRQAEDVTTNSIDPLGDPICYTLLAAFTAIAWAYALELNLKIFMTFKRKRGLYFWSLLISSWGLTLHALAFVLKFYVGSIHWALLSVIITIGWYCMVTGQALVLYSRLYLIVRNRTLLRSVLAMIITNVLLLHLPTTVFTFGSNSPDSAAWVPRFNVMERIQLAGFTIQETIISTIYVWATARLLKSISHGKIRRVMTQLIFINLCCIGMDIALVALEYTNRYIAEASVKPFVYAIKLRLEFAVLNQLMYLISSSPARNGHVMSQSSGSGSGTFDNSKSSSSSSSNALGTTNSADGSHELRRPSLGSWCFARAATPRPKANSASAIAPLPLPYAITKTQHVEVCSELATSQLEKSAAASSAATAAGSPNGSSGALSVSPSFRRNDTQSLMGTTMVGGPPRRVSGRRSGLHSPGVSESGLGLSTATTTSVVMEVQDERAMAPPVVLADQAMVLAEEAEASFGLEERSR